MPEGGRGLSQKKAWSCLAARVVLKLLDVKPTEVCHQVAEDRASTQRLVPSFLCVLCECGATFKPRCLGLARVCLDAGQFLLLNLKTVGTMSASPTSHALQRSINDSSVALLIVKPFSFLRG